MKKLKPHVKKLWVEALRSGEYQQGEQNLHFGGFYCCLGVLTDIYDKRRKNKDTTIWPIEAGSGNEMPHKKVCEWAALDAVITEQDSLFPSADSGFGKTPASKLARFNDEGWSFKKIAAYIERYL